MGGTFHAMRYVLAAVRMACPMRVRPLSHGAGCLPPARPLAQGMEFACNTWTLPVNNAAQADLLMANSLNLLVHSSTENS